MVTLAFSLGPLLLLAATWLLLLAHDDSRVDRRRAVQVGAGCVVLAIAATVGAVLGDRQDDRPPAAPGQTVGPA